MLTKPFERVLWASRCHLLCACPNWNSDRMLQELRSIAGVELEAPVQQKSMA